MGRTARSTTNASQSKYKEFAFDSGANTASGRIYTDSVKKTDKSQSYGLSLTINGLVIVGCRLVMTANSNFISLPSYKASNGEFKNLVYMVEEEDIKFLRDLAAEIVKVI